MKSLAQAERLLGRRLSKPELVLFISHRHNPRFIMAAAQGRLVMQLGCLAAGAFAGAARMPANILINY